MLSCWGAFVERARQSYRKNNLLGRPGFFEAADDLAPWQIDRAAACVPPRRGLVRRLRSFFGIVTEVA
jgi:hypothetical protein